MKEMHKSFLVMSLDNTPYRMHPCLCGKQMVGSRSFPYLMNRSDKILHTVRDFIHSVFKNSIERRRAEYVVSSKMIFSLLSKDNSDCRRRICL